MDPTSSSSASLPNKDWQYCKNFDIAASPNGDPDFIEESAGSIVVSTIGRVLLSSSSCSSSSSSSAPPPLLRPFTPSITTNIPTIDDPTSFLIQHVEIPTEIVPVACPPQILETILQQLRCMRSVPMRQLNLHNDELLQPEPDMNHIQLRFRSIPPGEDQFVNLAPYRMPIVNFAVVYAPTAKADGAQKALNYLKRKLSEVETKCYLQVLIVSPEYQLQLQLQQQQPASSSPSVASFASSQQQQSQPKPRNPSGSSTSSSTSSSSSSGYGNSKLQCIIPDVPEPSSTFVHIPWCPGKLSTTTQTQSRNQQQQQQQQQQMYHQKSPQDTKTILQNFCITVATAAAGWACGRLRSLAETPNATFFATALDEAAFSLLQGPSDKTGRLEMRAAKYRADLHLLLGRPLQALQLLNHPQLFDRNSARGPGDFLWICGASDTLCAIRWICLRCVIMTAKRDADWIFENRRSFIPDQPPEGFEAVRATLTDVWGRWSKALRIDQVSGKSNAFPYLADWAKGFRWSCISFDGTVPVFDGTLGGGGGSGGSGSSIINNNNNNVISSSTPTLSLSDNNANAFLGPGSANLSNSNNANTSTSPFANINNNTLTSNLGPRHKKSASFLGGVSSGGLTAQQIFHLQQQQQQQQQQLQQQQALIQKEQCVPAREFEDFLFNLLSEFEEDLKANISTLQDIGSRVIFPGSDRIAAVPRLEAEARLMHFLALRCIVQPTSVYAPRVLLSSCRDYVRKYLAYAHAVSRDLNLHFISAQQQQQQQQEQMNQNVQHQHQHPQQQQQQQQQQLASSTRASVGTHSSSASQNAPVPKTAAASPSYVACLVNGLEKFKTIRFALSWMLRRAGLHRSAVEFLRESLCSTSSMLNAAGAAAAAVGGSSSPSPSSASSSLSSPCAPQSQPLQQTVCNAIVSSPLHDPVLMMELWTELLRWVGVNVSVPLSSAAASGSAAGVLLSASSSSSFYQRPGRSFIDSILPDVENASPNRPSPITGDIVRAFVEQAFSGIVFAQASTSSSTAATSGSSSTSNSSQQQLQSHSRTLSGQAKNFPPNFTAKQLALQTKRQHVTAALNTMRIRASTVALLRINKSFFSEENCVRFFQKFLSSCGSGNESQGAVGEPPAGGSLPGSVSFPSAQNFATTSTAPGSQQSFFLVGSSASSSSSSKNQQNNSLTAALQSQQQSLMMQTSINASPNGECGAGLSVVGVEAKPLAPHLSPQPFRFFGYMEGAFKDDFYFSKNSVTGATSRTGPVIWVVDEVCVIRVELHNSFVFPLQVDRVALRNCYSYNSYQMSNNNNNNNNNNAGIAFDSTMLTIPPQQSVAVDLFFQPVIVGEAQIDGVVWNSASLCGSAEIEFFAPFPAPLVTPVMDELPSATIKIDQNLSLLSPYFTGNLGGSAPSATDNASDIRDNNNALFFSVDQHYVHSHQQKKSSKSSPSSNQLPQITIFQGQRVEIPILIVNTGTTPIPLSLEKLDRASKMWFSTMNASAHEQHCQLRVCAGCASVVQILAPDLMGLRTLEAGESFPTTLVVNPKEGWIVPSSGSGSNSGNLPASPSTYNSSGYNNASVAASLYGVNELTTITTPAVPSHTLLQSPQQQESPSTRGHSYSLSVVSPRAIMHKYSQSIANNNNNNNNNNQSQHQFSSSQLPPPPPFFVPPAVVFPVTSNVRLEVFASKEPPFAIEHSEISKLGSCPNVFCHLPARMQRLNLKVNILPSVRALSVTLSASKRIHVTMINDNREWAVEMKRDVELFSERGELLDTLKISSDVICGPGHSQVFIAPVSSSRLANAAAAFSSAGPHDNNHHHHHHHRDPHQQHQQHDDDHAHRNLAFHSPSTNFYNTPTPVAILKDAYSLVFHWQYIGCYERFREGKTEVALASIRHQITEGFSVADLNVAVTVASDEFANMSSPAATDEGEADDLSRSASGLAHHPPFVKTIKKWIPRSNDMIVESEEALAVDVLGSYRVQVVISAPKSWLPDRNEPDKGDHNTSFEVDFDVPGGAMIDGCTKGSLEFKTQVISFLQAATARTGSHLCVVDPTAAEAATTSERGTAQQEVGVELSSAAQQTRVLQSSEPITGSNMSRGNTIDFGAGNINDKNDNRNNYNSDATKPTSKIDPNHIKDFSFTAQSLESSNCNPPSSSSSAKRREEKQVEVAGRVLQNESKATESGAVGGYGSVADDEGSIAPLVNHPDSRSEKTNPEKQAQGNTNKKPVDDKLHDEEINEAGEDDGIPLEDDLPEVGDGNGLDDDDEDECVAFLDQDKIIERQTGAANDVGDDDNTAERPSTPSPSQAAASRNNYNNKLRRHSRPVARGSIGILSSLPTTSNVSFDLSNDSFENNNNNNNKNNFEHDNPNALLSRTSLISSTTSRPETSTTATISPGVSKRFAAILELDCLLFAVGTMKLRITLKTGQNSKTFVVPLLVQASHY